MGGHHDVSFRSREQWCTIFLQKERVSIVLEGSQNPHVKDVLFGGILVIGMITEPLWFVQDA